jgi:exopolysaccharide biosynthesis protein
MGAFAGAREAIGCGPRLVTDGFVTVDPSAEGFHDPKILSASAERSAVGLTGDGRMLFVATSGTIRDLADVMRDLGARDAMAFDGGASTGLWLRGKSLVTPGRLINNALLVTPKI